MYYNSLFGVYDGSDGEGKKSKFFVKTYVCDLVEIDRKDIIYWSEKVALQKTEVLELINILHNVSLVLNNNSLMLNTAQRYEFGNNVFSKPHVTLYKDKTLEICDGKCGRVLLDDTTELKHLLNLLTKATNNA